MRYLTSLRPLHSNTMQTVYHDCKDPDGFLYITYSGENQFGSCD